MQKLTAKRLNEIFTRMRKVHIAVVGDLMIDRYVWGRIERISPEAPVPIVALEGESASLGGAANVAANTAALGAVTSIFGAAGDDPQGRQLRQLLQQSGFSDDGVITDPGRMTSVKTRVISQSQHILRIDRETTNPVGEVPAQKLVDQLTRELHRFQAVILQDYNKGALTPEVIRAILNACHKADLPVGVDPKRDNFWAYRGATLFKPNLRELENALARRLSDETDLLQAAPEVSARLETKYLLVTRGEKGMMLFTDNRGEFIPTQTKRVHDVSGAGDTVIATIMTALAAGAEIHEAAVMANYAASVVIAEVGAVPVDPLKLRRACLGR